MQAIRKMASYINKDIHEEETYFPIQLVEKYSSEYMKYTEKKKKKLLISQTRKKDNTRPKTTEEIKQE